MQEEKALPFGAIIPLPLRHNSCTNDKTTCTDVLSEFKKMKKKHIILITAISFAVILACALPLGWALAEYAGRGKVNGLAGLSGKKSAEPTPFQPFKQTATPTEAASPITGALVPNEGMVPPAGQVNILLLGSDWRPNSGYRTDTVLLISVFTKEAKVKIVSFPRDLWIKIPGADEGRINTAMASGGFPLLAETFEHNFAVPVDHYMMTNLQGFRAIVDTLGGIDIDTSKNTQDSCDISYSQGKWCSVGPGQVHLDGEMALWYVRARYTSDDFDRTRRAQEALIGLFRKIMSLDAVTKAPEIYNQFISNVETDLNLNDILTLINLAPTILNDTSRIERYTITRDHVTPYTIPSSGANVLLPDYVAIWGVIKESVYTP